MSGESTGPTPRTDVPPAASDAIVKNVPLARERLATGDRLTAEKQLRQAAFAYQDATHADPDSSEAHFKLATTYAQLGYFARAVDGWKRVLELQPEGPVVQASRDNLSRAASRLRIQGESSGLPVGPILDSARARARQSYEVGVARIGERQFTPAVEALTLAIQHEPTLAVAYVARGSALIGLRRYGDAATDYQFALRLDPSLAAPLYGLAEAFRALGRSTDAKSYYERYATATSLDVRAELQADARKKADAIR